MALDALLQYPALVVYQTRSCTNCGYDVTVHENRCDECGRHIPAPTSHVRRVHREVFEIPATAFTLQHAAAAMGSLNVCVVSAIN